MYDEIGRPSTAVGELITQFLRIMTVKTRIPLVADGTEMSPENKKNMGGALGRAASGMLNTRDAARTEAGRTDDLRVLVRSLAILSCTLTVLVFGAPDVWPHLFGH